MQSGDTLVLMNDRFEVGLELPANDVEVLVLRRRSRWTDEGHAEDDQGRAEMGV